MQEKISKNIFWLTISRAIALTCLFFAHAKLFRYLGPFGSGQYNFVLSYVMFFSIVVDFGVLQFITKKISEQPEKAKEYFYEFFKFELLVAFILYLTLVCVAWLNGFPTVVFYAIGLAGLGLFANALTYPFLAVMTAFQDLKKVALINFLNSLVNIAVIFLAIYFKKYIVFLSSVQLAFGVLSLILYLYFCKKYIGKINLISIVKNYTFSNLTSIFKYSWPFALLVGFSAIYNRIDVIIITKFLGYEQTGLYSAAYKFFDLLNFFPASVSHVLFPLFAMLMAGKQLTLVRENIEKYLRVMIFAALPVAVGGTLLSKNLISLVAGEQFASSAEVLSILIWAVCILFIYIPLNSLVISQLTKKAMVVTGVNVLVNILGNFILVPKFGIKAAAFMTVFSETIQAVFYFYFVKTNIVEFDFVKYLLKPVFAAAIMGIFIFLIKGLGLFFALSGGSLVYLLTLFIVGFFRQEEFIKFSSLFKKQSNIL